MMITTRNRFDTPSPDEVVDELARRAPGRPRSTDADEAIVHATLELLAEGGLPAVTMEAVAARAGVAKTTVYRRHDSPMSLVAAAAGELALDAVPAPDLGSLRRDLEAIVGDVARVFKDDATRRVIASLISAAARDEALHEALVGRLVRPFRASMAGVLERAERDGELRRGLDRDVLYDLLIAPVFHRALVTGAALDAEWRRAHVEMVLAGVGQPTAG